MQSKQLTVSVGIPARNEARNIGFLLEHIFTQKQEGFSLLEVIIFSDDSTDETVTIANSFLDRGVRVIEGSGRQGVNNAQNVLVREARGDVLILLNADVLLGDDLVFARLVEPMIEDSTIGIVSAKIVSFPAKTFFEQIIEVSHEFKNDLYQKVQGGENLYLCHGRARAFSRQLYSVLTWPENVPEDSYSFLFCREQGFRFLFAEKAVVYFRSPATFLDHLKQSQRFTFGKRALRNFFDEELIASNYHLPAKVLLSTFLEFLFRYPVSMIAYVSIFCAALIFPKGKRKEQSRWESSVSTKIF